MQTATRRHKGQQHRREKVLHAADLMAANIHRPDRGVDFYARTVGYQRQSFHRAFVRVLGIGPQLYLRDLRIRRAMTLLKTTDLRVVDVGARVGYPVLCSFQKAFAATTGHSPSSWRVRERVALAVTR